MADLWAAWGLVLGPLGGAPVAVITGAMALAFSLAWAVLAAAGRIAAFSG